MIPEPDAPWINVFIDSNVWNFLFERQIDLAVDLPPDKFCLCHTREVELENGAIPPEKAELKAFIDGDDTAAAIALECISTDCLRNVVVLHMHYCRSSFGAERAPQGLCA